MGLDYRPLAPSDLTQFSRLVSDWNVVRQLGSFPWPPDPDFTASRCRPYDGAGFVWGVFLHGDLIGTVAVTDAVLGYCFALHTAGQGIATCVARVALTFAFFDPSLAQVTAKAWADNSASIRVLDKLGFVETGRSVEHAKARNLMVGSVNFSLSRDRWVSRSARSA